MKAIALVEARDHVCCRYRIRAFEPMLEASGWSLTIEPLAAGIFGRLAQFRRLEEYDTVLLQRKLLPAWQLRDLRRRSRRLVFDFDDAVLYRDSYDRRGPHHKRRSDRFQGIVGLADQVIAGNDFLAECALVAGARPERVRVIPTCVASSASRSVRGDRPSDPVDLVWIGSSSTMAGLDRQRALWERLGREVPGIRLKMICDRFIHFDALPVVEAPWSEATEADEVTSADVGISWIPDDLWSRGKCGLKVLQYQAAGLPVVANPVGVHTQMIRPGVDGFLPDSADEWIRSIRTLVQDPGLRARMGQAARESRQAHYSVEGWASAFVAAVSGLDPRGDSEPRTGTPYLFRNRDAPPSPSFSPPSHSTFPASS